MTTYAHGFSLRKRRILARFVGAPVKPLKRNSKLSTNDRLFLWGSTPAPAGLPTSVPVCRVEDGFLRSVGLGAALASPLSWVIDRKGIYYDPRRPSELESILGTTTFSENLLKRAAAVRQKIIAHGLSKYNVGTPLWRRKTTKRVILVPGQVEDDASIRAGAVEINTNMGLLCAVRAANREAHVIYKPHPDVVHGLRKADDADASMIADEVVTDADIGEMLDQVDEVHCMTSLAGFEALLRGKCVVCYGQPFYAGWGLTSDVVPLSRRKRKLTLDELVAGALILYPRYLHPRTGEGSSIESAIDRLIERKTSGPSWLDKLKVNMMRWMAA